MHKVHFSSLLLLIGLLGTVFLTVAAQSGEAETTTGITMSARAGFDGFYKSEFWVPVHVTVANTGPAVEGDIRLTVGSSAAGDRVVYNAPISLPTQSNKRVTLLVNLARAVSTPQVELRNDQDQLIATVATNTMSPTTPDTLLYGVVSPEPGRFSVLESAAGGRSRAAVAFLEMADLPETAVGWSALDILVLNDVDTGQLTAGQLGALEAWVSSGGQLVVTGGPGWQKTTAALAEMLPVTVTGSESVDDLPALRQQAGVPFRDPGPYVVATGSLSRGELLWHQEGLPLLARQSRGRGAVYFLALDPKLAPLVDWDGSEVVWAEVADRVPAPLPWGMNLQNSYAAGTAVSSLPSLALPSTVQFILFLLVYVVAVGPVNYVALRRLKRLELAWITIPVLIVLFSAITYVTGFQLRGNQTIINQMSVVHSRVGSEQARVQSLIGLYSPRRSTYDLILPGDAAARPFEQSFGAIGGSGNIESITRDTALTIREIRVDVADVETFIAESYRPALPITGEASLSLNSSDVQLNATIVNNSDTTLENATLLLGAAGIALGNIGPGESKSITEVVGRAPTETGTFGPAPAPVPGPATGSPLTSHAEVILGTADYYNDRNTFPRWQLLQAVEGSGAPAVGATESLSGDVVTLVAWARQQQIEVGLNRAEYETLSDTLYLFELPLTQNIVSGTDVAVPVSLLNWQALATNGVHQPAIHNLDLSADGWIEFEYEPWPEFQAMVVNELAIVLETQASATEQPPEIRFWDWQQEVWVTIAEAGWGKTAVPEHARFIGANNVIRLRLQDRSQFGVHIDAVYPALTGDLP